MMVPHSENSHRKSLISFESNRWPAFKMLAKAAPAKKLMSPPHAGRALHVRHAKCQAKRVEKCRRMLPPPQASREFEIIANCGVEHRASSGIM